MSKPTFTKISQNETRIDYKGNKFMLVEQDRGVYGMGRAIQLYLMKGFEKEHIKEIGWTKGDGFNTSNSDMKDACITRLTTLDECKKAAIKYIDAII